MHNTFVVKLDSIVVGTRYNAPIICIGVFFLELNMKIFTPTLKEIKLFFSVHKNNLRFLMCQTHIRPLHPYILYPWDKQKYTNTWKYTKTIRKFILECHYKHKCPKWYLINFLLKISKNEMRCILHDYIIIQYVEVKPNNLNMIANPVDNF